MGNGLSLSPSCLHLPATPTAVRLVYWGGQSRQLVVTGGGDSDAVVTAGDVAAELPAPAAGHAVCPADAFFVGLPIPAMSPGEEHLPGRTYFVLPAARLPCLKALTLAAPSYGDGGSNGNGKRKQPLFALAGCPFEHAKGADGGVPHQGPPGVHQEAHHLRRHRRPRRERERQGQGRGAVQHARAEAALRAARRDRQEPPVVAQAGDHLRAR